MVPPLFLHDTLMLVSRQLVDIVFTTRRFNFYTILVATGWTLFALSPMPVYPPYLGSPTRSDTFMS